MRLHIQQIFLLVTTLFWILSWSLRGADIGKYRIWYFFLLQRTFSISNETKTRKTNLSLLGLSLKWLNCCRLKLAPDSTVRPRISLPCPSWSEALSPLFWPSGSENRRVRSAWFSSCVDNDDVPDGGLWALCWIPLEQVWLVWMNWLVDMEEVAWGENVRDERAKFLKDASGILDGL